MGSEFAQTWEFAWCRKQFSIFSKRRFVSHLARHWRYGLQLGRCLWKRWNLCATDLRPLRVCLIRAAPFRVMGCEALFMSMPVPERRAGSLLNSSLVWLVLRFILLQHFQDLLRGVGLLLLFLVLFLSLSWLLPFGLSSRLAQQLEQGVDG